MASQLVRILLLGMLPAFLLSLVLLRSNAQAESRPRYGKSLISSLLEEPLVVDPLAARTHTDMTLVSLVFDTLYQVIDGKVKPHLAASLPDYTEPMRVVIALRPGVLFHNGSALRAQDVVASLERLRKSDLGFLLEGVRGIRDITEAKAGSAVRIEFSLRAADGALARRLSGVHTSIVAGGKAPTWRTLVGTGAWQLHQRSSRRSTLTLHPFTSHFAGRPFLNSLVLRWHKSADAEARNYEAGGSHISARGEIAFAGHRPKYATDSVHKNIRALAFLGFGKTQAIAREPEFRRAVSLAIGRSGMRRIGSGEEVAPTTTVLPSKHAPREFALQANPKAARSLLSGLAGRYPALVSKTLSLQILVNESRPDDAVIAGRVAAGLFELGIATRIVSLGADSFRRRTRRGDCELYVGQLAPSGGLLAASGAPGLAFLRKALVVGGQVKLAHKLFRESRSAIERIFAANMPLVPLFHRALKLHLRSNVGGVAFSSTQTIDYPGIFVHGEPVKN